MARYDSHAHERPFVNRPKPRSGRTTRTPFGPGIELGKLFGVKIFADYSLLIIMALVTVNIGAGVLPAWHPHWSALLTWTVAATAAVLFFGSILLHELSHALVGRKVGIPISGITLFMFGGVAQMEKEPDRPRAEFLMAIVGPITSIGIGVVATLIGVWSAQNAIALGNELEALPRVGPVATLLLWLGPINVLIGLFNMVPGFPLDGGRVLRSILWWATGSFRKATRWASLAGQAVAWTLITLGVFMAFGFRVPLFGAGIVQGLWLVLIGWFLSRAARTSYEQVVINQALENVPVSRLMLSRLDAVPPDMSVAELVQSRLMHSDQRCFPVLSDGRLDGLVCIEDVRKVPEQRWTVTQVGEIMTPASRLLTLDANAQSGDAMRALARRDVDQIPVVENGRLLGLVRRQDILKWLGLHARDPQRA
jgi:Zn-dependent protease/CBS domain-containing protein